MAKRPSILDKIEQELPKPAEPVATPEPKTTAKLTATGPLKTTVYIPPHVHERLREIGYTERKRLNDLVMEGLNRVLEARGHAERTGKTPS